MSADKLKRPSKNFTDKNRAERERENFMSGNFTDVNSAAENSTSKNFAAENSTSKNSATENSISANSASENSTNENFVNENSATENFASENSATARSVPNSELISVRDLVLRYGRSEILNIPSLDLNTSGITALLGSNGSGKSTLLRILAFCSARAAAAWSFGGSRRPLCRRCGRPACCCPSPCF